MNLSAIPRDRWYGRLLRFPLRVLPRQLDLPILQGALRGRRWVVGSSTHGCWLGSYEYEKRLAFERTVCAGMVVFDVGAHVGFYTLLASVLVGPRGRVVAFEPAPRNLTYLKRHLALNKASNVDVVEAAVSDVSGEQSFDPTGCSETGHLSRSGSERVRTVVIDELVASGRVPEPDCMKIDVEGGELAVLRGSDTLLRNRRPIIFLAVHGDEIRRECIDRLSWHGYQLGALDSRRVIAASEILATGVTR